MAKKLLFTLSLLALLVTSFALAGIASAQTEYVCYWTGVTDAPAGTVLHSFFYDADGQLLFTRVRVAQTDHANFLAGVLVPRGGWEAIYVDGYSYGNWYFNDWTLPMSNCAGGYIGDGRLNDGQQGAPLAVYCAPLGDGSVDVYDIDAATAEGALAFRAYGEEIATGLREAASSGTAVEISDGLGDSLWASPEGALTVVGADLRDASKLYSFGLDAQTCGG